MNLLDEAILMSTYNIQVHDKRRLFSKISLNICWAIGRTSYRNSNGLESAMVNDPSVFESLKVYWKLTGIRFKYPASILYKSIAGRYRPVSYPDGPVTARYRFIKNAYWVVWNWKHMFCIWFVTMNFSDRAQQRHLFLCSGIKIMGEVRVIDYN